MTFSLYIIIKKRKLFEFKEFVKKKTKQIKIYESLSLFLYIFVNHMLWVLVYIFDVPYYTTSELFEICIVYCVYGCASLSKVMLYNENIDILIGRTSF